MLNKFSLINEPAGNILTVSENKPIKNKKTNRVNIPKRELIFELFLAVKCT